MPTTADDNGSKTTVTPQTGPPLVRGNIHYSQLQANSRNGAGNQVQMANSTDWLSGAIPMWSADGTLTPSGQTSTPLVSSVFGRTGAVVGQAHDYNASQIDNAVSVLGSYADPPWITSINYSKLTGTPSSAQISTFQTPWLSDIDGGNHVLKNVAQIGVGIATPQATFQVKTASNVDLSVRSGGAILSGSVAIAAINDAASANIPLEIVATTTAIPYGNVGINKSPSYPLDVAGDINTTGQFRVNGVPFSGGGTPGGSSGQVQFNNSGAFGGNPVFVWNNANGRLGIGTASPDSWVHVQPGDSSAIPLLHLWNPVNNGGAQMTAFIHTDQPYSSPNYTGAALKVTTYPNTGATNLGDTLRVGSGVSDGTAFTPFLVVKAATGKVSLGTSSAAQGPLTIQTPNGYGICLAASSYGVNLYNDNSNFYFLLSNSGDPYGGFNGLRPLYINLSNGVVYNATGLVTSNVFGNPSVMLGNANGTSSPPVIAMGFNTAGDAYLPATYGLYFYQPTSTSLIIRVKCSDGAVRAAVLTIS